MRLEDVQKQLKWVEYCDVTVRSIGKAYQNPDTGKWEQVIEITGSDGWERDLHYRFKDEACTDGIPMGMVEPHETGKQCYRIKWTGHEFIGKPALAPPKETLNATANKPTDWDAVNLGKCRHGVLCAMLSSNDSDGNKAIIEWESVDGVCLPRIDKRFLPIINKLARFSMTGEIE